MKKKITVDLDVVTVALWNKKGEQFEIANKFMNRARHREFYLVNPFFLIERVLKWKYEELKEDIKEFYLNIGIKDEDALLVFINSLFELDYLVTFNRKHLKNNAERINEVLRRHKLNEIKIVSPDEL